MPNTVLHYRVKRLCGGGTGSFDLRHPSDVMELLWNSRATFCSACFRALEPRGLLHQKKSLAELNRISCWIPMKSLLQWTRLFLGYELILLSQHITIQTPPLQTNLDIAPHCMLVSCSILKKKNKSGSCTLAPATIISIYALFSFFKLKNMEPHLWLWTACFVSAAFHSFAVRTTSAKIEKYSIRKGMYIDGTQQ